MRWRGCCAEANCGLCSVGAGLRSRACQALQTSCAEMSKPLNAKMPRTTEAARWIFSKRGRNFCQKTAIVTSATRQTLATSQVSQSGIALPEKLAIVWGRIDGRGRRKADENMT